MAEKSTRRRRPCSSCPPREGGSACVGRSQRRASETHHAVQLVNRLLGVGDAAHRDEPEPARAAALHSPRHCKSAKGSSPPGSEPSETGFPGRTGTGTHALVVDDDGLFAPRDAVKLVEEVAVGCADRKAEHAEHIRRLGRLRESGSAIRARRWAGGERARGRWRAWAAVGARCGCCCPCRIRPSLFSSARVERASERSTSEAKRRPRSLAQLAAGSREAQRCTTVSAVHCWPATAPVRAVRGEF